MNVNSSNARVEGSGQTVDFIEHSTAYVGRKKHTLRVLVHVDSHAFQAWGRVERWDGKRWYEVAAIRGEALRTDLKIGYVRDLTDAARVHAFKTDRDRLVELAEEVL